MLTRQIELNVLTAKSTFQLTYLVDKKGDKLGLTWGRLLPRQSINLV